MLDTDRPSAGGGRVHSLLGSVAGDKRRLHRPPGATVAAGDQIARDLIDGKLSELHAY